MGDHHVDKTQGKAICSVQTMADAIAMVMAGLIAMAFSFSGWRLLFGVSQVTGVKQKIV